MIKIFYQYSHFPTFQMYVDAHIGTLAFKTYFLLCKRISFEFI